MVHVATSNETALLRVARLAATVIVALIVSAAPADATHFTAVDEIQVVVWHAVGPTLAETSLVKSVPYAVRVAPPEVALLVS